VICWEGEHLAMIALDVVAILTYFVATPCMYVYIFFHLIPRYGLDDPRMRANFGFIWTRFEQRCYWWELVDMIRKIGLVLSLMLFANEPALQTVVGAACVTTVALVSFAVSPFVRPVYDRFDVLGCVIQLLILALGLLHYARTFRVGEKLDFDYSMMGFVFLLLLAFLLLATHAINDDMRRSLLKLRASRIRREKGLLLSDDVLRININTIEPPEKAILDWVEQITDETVLEKLRELERLVHLAMVKYSDPLARPRAELYEQLMISEPQLIDWLVSDEAVSLSPFVTALLNSTADDEFDEEGKVRHVTSKNVFGSKYKGALALWVGEIAGNDERASIRDIVYEVNKVKAAAIKRDAARWRERAARVLPSRLMPAVAKIWPEEAGSIAIRRRGSQCSQEVGGEDPDCGASSAPTRSLTRHKTAKLMTHPKVGPTLKDVMKTGGIDDRARVRLLFENKIEAVIDSLMRQVQCESIMLLPVGEFTSELSDGPQQLPEICRLAATEGMPDHLARKALRGVSMVGHLSEGTPAYDALNSKKVVKVDNALLDQRYRRKATLDAISQLCAPVLSEDDSRVVGVTICRNKISINGHSGGLPFDNFDTSSVQQYQGQLARLIKFHWKEQRLTGTAKLLVASASTMKWVNPVNRDDKGPVRQKTRGFIAVKTVEDEDAAEEPPTAVTPVVEAQAEGPGAAACATTAAASPLAPSGLQAVDIAEI